MAHNIRLLFVQVPIVISTQHAQVCDFICPTRPDWLDVIDR